MIQHHYLLLLYFLYNLNYLNIIEIYFSSLFYKLYLIKFGFISCISVINCIYYILYSMDSQNGDYETYD